MNGASELAEIYRRPKYTGRVSVPVLWDKDRRTRANNSLTRSSAWTAPSAASPKLRTDYYPQLRDEDRPQ